MDGKGVEGNTYRSADSAAAIAEADQLSPSSEFTFRITSKASAT